MQFGTGCLKSVQHFYMYKSQFSIKNDSLSSLGGIRLAGSVVGGVGVIETTRILRSYSLVLVTEGKGSYRDDTGVSFNLLPGDVILIDPECKHWYGPDRGTVWDEIFIVFEGPLFDLWAENNLLDLRRKRLRFTPLNHWIERFVHTCGTQHNGNHKDQVKDVLRVQQLLYEVHEASQTDRGSSQDWLEKAKQLIQTEEDMHTVAEFMGVHYQTFRKKFKQKQGMAPQQYRIYLNVQLAQKRLAERDDPIYKIASDLGYCDEFHFSKQFKKFIGCSPSEYRQSVIERN